MNTIKSAVGMGKKDEEGQEPVSGEKGEGTTAEPFDAGNQPVQEQTNTADTAETTKAEDTTAATTSETSPTSDSQKDTKKGGSSLLKSVNPFSKRKGDDKQEDSKATESQASAGASADKAKIEEEEKNLPPNHLGVNVPEGASTDFAPPQPPEPQGPNNSKNMSSNQEETNQSVVNASADGVDTGAEKSEGSFGQPGQLNPDRSGSAGGQAAAAKLRGSRASVAEPTKQRVFNPHSTNPGRIPTAGGVAVGQKQSEQRRQSRVSADMGTKSSLMDKEGAPDSTTQNNTQNNTTPNGEGSSKNAEPAPVFSTPDFAGDGGASAGAEKKDEPTPATTTEGSSTTESPSTTEKMKDKVKENVPSPSSGGSATKERRGSRMDMLKGKLGIGKK